MRIYRALLIALLCGFFTKTDAELKISIITCDPGNDLYSIYGHSAVRIQDSLQGTDVVYNYGTFDFTAPNFYWNFTRGKLDYYLDVDTYERFSAIYQHEKRPIHEQVLILDSLSAFRVDSFLKWNSQEENKKYKYDFLYDNCSTRIRDIFIKLFGTRFVFGALSCNGNSFRSVLDNYETNLHWERVGINFLMSHEVDKKMDNNTGMFLPDFLYQGFSTATLDGKFVLAGIAPTQLNRTFQSTQTNVPLLVFGGLLVLYLTCTFLPSLKSLLIYLDTFLFLILGLLGFFILFMWFGTDHQVCKYNLNLLWCFPLHILFAFMLPRKSEKIAEYARLAIQLVLLFTFYSVFISEQQIDVELWPLIILVYMRLKSYKISKWNNFPNSFNFQIFKSN